MATKTLGKYVLCFLALLVSASPVLLIQSPTWEWTLTFYTWVLPTMGMSLYLLALGERLGLVMSAVTLFSIFILVFIKSADWTETCKLCPIDGYVNFFEWDQRLQLRVILEIIPFSFYLIGISCVFSILKRRAKGDQKITIAGFFIILTESFFLFSDLIASSYWNSPAFLNFVTVIYFSANFKLIITTIHILEFLVIQFFIWQAFSRKTIEIQ
jgi:hypothetical protein